MIDNIDALVTSYEHGTLTRRHLLQALAMIAAPVAGHAQTTSGSVMRARMLHHVNVRVSDVGRSETFYRKLFGLPASRRVQGPDNHGLDLPGSGSDHPAEKRRARTNRSFLRRRRRVRCRSAESRGTWRRL